MRLRRRAGHTLIEMVVTITVMGILASVILPLAAMTRKREKEIELRRSLRDIRSALDLYHELCLASQSVGGQPGHALTGIVQIRPEGGFGTCWPEDLDILVEGVATSAPRYELKFLRRIPKDPFLSGHDENDGHGWIYRSTTDSPEGSGGWNRQNVFDVRSSSESQGLDGSYYKDW